SPSRVSASSLNSAARRTSRVVRGSSSSCGSAYCAKSVTVRFGLTLLMLTPELAGRADLRVGCPYGKAERVHAGVPSGGGGAGAGYGSADRARGRGDRRGCATAGPLGPAGTRAARSASEPGDAF